MSENVGASASESENKKDDLMVSSILLSIYHLLCLFVSPSFLLVVIYHFHFFNLIHCIRMPFPFSYIGQLVYILFLCYLFVISCTLLVYSLLLISLAVFFYLLMGDLYLYFLLFHKGL